MGVPLFSGGGGQQTFKKIGETKHFVQEWGDMTFRPGMGGGGSIYTQIGAESEHGILHSKYARKWPNFNCFEQSGLTPQIKTFDTILTLGTKRHLKVSG